MSVPVGRVEVRARALGFRTAYAEFRISESGHTARLKLSTMDVSAGRRFRDPLNNGGAGPEMVVIPAGVFTMGDAMGNPSEQPAHTVALTQAFALSVTEVSIASYLEFTRSTEEDLSSRLADAESDEPVRFVSWQQSRAYVAWLTAQTGNKYRLPTEAEWEYAARAGSQSAYFFGDDPSRLCEFANIADLSAKEIYAGWDVVECRDGHRKVAPVASLAANPFGLHDIYGNVAEWVAECGMPSYRDAPSDGSIIQGASCASHGFRGGSWDSQAPEMRSVYRNSAAVPNDDRGIRLLREL
jgi:formylglycine-generating enzyme required for sulfatase activity